MDGTTVANHALSAAQMAQVERLPGLVDATVAKGDVTIYQFYDLNCPYCRQATADIGRLIAADSGASPRVRALSGALGAVDRGFAGRTRRARARPEAFLRISPQGLRGPRRHRWRAGHQRDGRHGPRPQQNHRDRQQARHHRHHEDARPRRRRAEAHGHAGLCDPGRRDRRPSRASNRCARSSPRCGAARRSSARLCRRSRLQPPHAGDRLPPAAIRATASPTGSIVTLIWKALAWIMLLRPRAMATWPFQKMRSPRLQAGKVGRLAERLLLHVAVARAWDAAGGQRDLHQTRAVEAHAGLAAPEIGRADEPLRHRDEIGFLGVERREMPLRHDSRRTPAPRSCPVPGRRSPARRAATHRAAAT